jgi:hypothetical protein
MAEMDEYPNKCVRISDGFHGRDTITNRKRVAYMLSVVRDNIVIGEENNIYLSGGVAYLIRDRNHYYCDGALTDPYPYYYSNEHNKGKENAIGVWLLNRAEYDSLSHKENHVQFQEPFEYIRNILFIMYNQYVKCKYKKINKNTIPILFEKSSISVDITSHEKVEMYMMGMNACRIFMRKKLRLIRKKRLYLKYFYLWRMI